MSEISNWIFLLYFAFLFIIFFIWNKHNKSYLTIEEKKLASSLLREAAQREMKYIWAILVAILIVLGFLFVLEKAFAVKNATEFIFVLAALSLIRAIFRNRAIYQRANLPQKFIKGDFALGVFTILALVAVIISIFVD